MGQNSGGLAAAVTGEVPTGVSPEASSEKRAKCSTEGCTNRAIGAPPKKSKKAEAEEPDDAEPPQTESGERPVAAPAPAKSKKKSKDDLRKAGTKPKSDRCRRCQGISAQVIQASNDDDERRMEEIHRIYGRGR